MLFIYPVLGIILGARDSAVNKSCSLECEDCCPDFSPSLPAPCSWQPSSHLQSCLQSRFSFQAILQCRQIHLFPTPQPPAIVQAAPVTWGRHRINYRPIIFMHKTWHRRPPSLQLPSGRLGAQGREEKESYKIKEVNGSLGCKKRKREREKKVVFFLIFIHLASTSCIAGNLCSLVMRKS